MGPDTQYYSHSIDEARLKFSFEVFSFGLFLIVEQETCELLS